MKLFLASQANIVIGEIVKLLPDKSQNLNLIYIYTASKDEIDENSTKLENGVLLPDWAKLNRQDFINAGFKVQDLDIEGKNKAEINDVLKNIDIIFVEGGNTYYLLDHIRKSGFDEVVKEFLNKGIIYIGSSAGSIIMGPNIDIARRYDDVSKAPDLKDYRGLNLVDIIVVPHCDQKNIKDFLDLTLEDFKNKPYKLLLLNDNQFLEVDDNTYRVITAN